MAKDADRKSEDLAPESESTKRKHDDIDDDDDDEPVVKASKLLELFSLSLLGWQMRIFQWLGTKDTVRSRQCPYLDTIDRTVLDFDFEKLCSITLTRINVYACLVCGKYFQGNKLLSVDLKFTNDIKLGV